ncbi:MAG: nicotinamide mononucleotide transporter [Prevotella sp.]|nr:nicotinamide mononucleotide transporter [Prevotella sp.]
MALDWLDIFTTVLGLLYVWLEYRAHIALWIVGIIMPALDIYLYYRHGLYGDAGMAAYYTVAGIYGYVAWSLKKPEKAENAGHTASGIAHTPLRLYLPVAACFLLAWGATYYVLVTWTNSTVPVLDSFTNALSFVGLWALSRKYIEQWLFWIVVDVVCTVLYVQKGIPFKAGLYGLYVVIAVMGWFKWKRMMKADATV